MESTYKQVLMYEDKELQAKALSLIPIQELEERAENNNNKLPDERDELSRQLLYWFKRDFFKWVNEPICQQCNNKTKAIGRGQPTTEELKWQAYVVEIYQCTQCNKTIRFPRYNHPGKLLETREGRCGEWANCFCLFARALGFNVRFILDFTDHVWAELFSNHLNQFVHCDPCER